MEVTGAGEAEGQSGANGLTVAQRVKNAGEGCGDGCKNRQDDMRAVEPHTSRAVCSSTIKKAAAQVYKGSFLEACSFYKP